MSDRSTYNFTLANAHERNTEDIEDALKQVKLFDHLTSSQLQLLTESIVLVTYEAGEMKLITRG
jgi:hypothetical protein